MYSKANSRLKKKKPKTKKKPTPVCYSSSLICQDGVMGSHHNLSPTCLPKSHGDHQRRMTMTDAEVAATTGQA